MPFYVNLWPDDVHSPFFPPADRWPRGDGIDRPGPARKRAFYDAVVQTMDRQLGRVLDRISGDPDLRRNTLVLVCSDNGPEPGAGRAAMFGDRLRGHKGALSEGGIRSPLIVWAPGLMQSRPGGINETTVLSTVDLVASVRPLCGLPMLPAVGRPAFDGDGANMASVLLGMSDQERRVDLFWRRPPDRGRMRLDGTLRPMPDLAIRSGAMKLLCDVDGTGIELYDLAADPGERQNLADRRKKVRDRLLAAVLAWNRSLPKDAVAP